MAKKEIPVYSIDNLSEFNQKDILISRFAPYLHIHQNLSQAHKHSFYHLLLFTEGAGTHAIDFRSFEVTPYQIYFMVPGQVHSWNFEGKVDGYVVNFSELFFQSFLLKPAYLDQFSFFSGMVDDAVINLPGFVQAEITQVFEHLIRESETMKRQGPDMVRALLLQLFITVSRLHAEHPTRHATPYNYTLLRNFQSLIEQHYTNYRLPKAYAEMLYITPNHLNALCNDVWGIPAGEVIRNRIILEAKRQLINMELSISEIAYRLNFSDNSYFTKFFKKYEGITPEEFRKLNLRQADGSDLRLR